MEQIGGVCCYEASGVKPPTLDRRLMAATTLELTAYASG
jgi:hypothetical protein